MRDEAMLDGVMLGRAAYQNPEVLLGVDPLLFGAAAPAVGIDEALDRLEPAIAAHVAAGGRLHAFTRHMVGLFPGRRGARAWRRFLATEGVKPGADVQTFRAARARVAPMFEAAA
jgi:tRNA-dihydrouridine synthase A